MLTAVLLGFCSVCATLRSRSRDRGSTIVPATGAPGRRRGSVCWEWTRALCDRVPRDRAPGAIPGLRARHGTRHRRAAGAARDPNLLAAAPASSLPSQGAPLHASLARSGAIGLAHGLAGSAPVALLAMAAMPTPAAALAYLLVFGLGTIAGMVAFSLALWAPVARLGASAGASRWVTAGTGMLSLLFGAWLIYEIGFAAAQRAAV
jgi:hypothetical protein